MTKVYGMNQMMIKNCNAILLDDNFPSDPLFTNESLNEMEES